MAKDVPRPYWPSRCWMLGPGTTVVLVLAVVSVRTARVLATASRGSRALALKHLVSSRL
ncbi:hypothetical protein E4T47_05079 [Aureobasidium subglaciale]|nr:hypothetical protein E4T47_05079 [Aureobasidium subglaciale]